MFSIYYTVSNYNVGQHNIETG